MEANTNSMQVNAAYLDQFLTCNHKHSMQSVPSVVLTI